MANELTKVSAEIAALEAELLNDDNLMQDYTQPPKLEVYADKKANKGTFTLGIKDDKMDLGDEVDVAYITRGSEVRSVMEDGADAPLCSAIDGIPVKWSGDKPFAKNCAACKYSQWSDDGKPYRDERGNTCRTRKHIPVEVFVDVEGERRMTPAILVVPPTSLKFERQFRGALASTARLKAGGTITNMAVRLSTAWVSDKFKYATLRFEALGSVRDYLGEDDYLQFLKDKKNVTEAIASGASNAYDNHDDIASQKVSESKGRGHTDMAKSGDAGLDAEELPF